jgi:hypothetical protein
MRDIDPQISQSGAFGRLQEILRVTTKGDREMKQQRWKAGLVVMLVMAMTGSVALAAAGTAAPAPNKTPPAAPAQPAPAKPTHTELFCPDLWAKFHNPTPWLSMGLDERFRVEAGQNWKTLNGQTDHGTVANPDHLYLYERYRTRWWANWVLGENVTFNTRLVWETRTWQYPEAGKWYTNPRHTGGQNPYLTEWNPDEALFDWFNVNVKNIAGLPLSATVGRQDMIFGVGWLVLDASPLDGSRTIGMFDAIRLTYNWADAHTKIDAVYANNAPQSDRWLKPINDQARGLMEQYEEAVILYLTNTSFKPVQLEGYFIYKQDSPLAQGETLTNFSPLTAEAGEVYTFGAAISGTHAEHWKYRAEGAFQTGRKAGDLPPTAPDGDPIPNYSPYGHTEDLRAFGTLDTLEYQFKDARNSATHITYEYDSGDNPDTNRDERFDLLWGRWPRWSELLLITYTSETRVGDMTNLHRLNVGHRFDLSKQWQLAGDYHALWADENSGAISPSLHVANHHKFRGSLLVTSLKYKFNDQLSGYGWFEYFVPGEYYVSPSDDNAWFFRFNLEYIF